jgi:hypothetical protein
VRPVDDSWRWRQSSANLSALSFPVWRENTGKFWPWRPRTAIPASPLRWKFNGLPVRPSKIWGTIISGVRQTNYSRATSRGEFGEHREAAGTASQNRLIGAASVWPSGAPGAVLDRHANEYKSRSRRDDDGPSRHRSTRPHLLPAVTSVAGSKCRPISPLTQQATSG